MTVHRPPDRPSAPQAYQCKKIQSTGMATQMQRKKIAWPPGLLERKSNNKDLSFSTLFLMFTLTWITEKELERVIENKRDEFCRKKKNMKTQSGFETMRNASGQQSENARQWKIKANMNRGDKILGKHIRQFLHKNNVYQHRRPRRSMCQMNILIFTWTK